MEVGALEPRQSHIDQLGLPAGRDHHVGGLDVAVHDVARLGMGQGLGYLERVTDGLGQRENSLLLHQRSEVGPFDELEYDERKPLVFANVVDLDDIVVVQRAADCARCGIATGFGVGSLLRRGLSRPRCDSFRVHGGKPVPYRLRPHSSSSNCPTRVPGVKRGTTVGRPRRASRAEGRQVTVVILRRHSVARHVDGSPVSRCRRPTRRARSR